MHDRSKHIGSSDIAGILGISQYKTPLDVYLSKVEPKPNNPTKEMIRGKILEPLVLQFLEQDKNIKAKQTNEHVYHDEYSFLASEIDAVSECGIQIEIKTSNHFMGKFWGDTIENIPIDYLAQMYWAMGLNKKDKCLLCVLIGYDIKYYEVEQNIDIFNNMLIKAVDFWFSHVLPKLPPKAKNCDDLYKLFPQSNQQSIEATNEISDKIGQLKNIKNTIKELQIKQNDIEFSIKEYLKDNEILTFDNKTIATYKVINRKESLIKATSFKQLKIKD